jgi:sugar phosphate isomerase/epimerase
MKLQVGLNPYGLTYHLGLQGRGTERANPNGRGLDGFIAIATELGATVLEIYEPWLQALSDDDLSALRDRLGALGMWPVVSAGLNTLGPLESAMRSARLLGADTIRLGLSGVLCGDRNLHRDGWGELCSKITDALKTWGPRAADAGVMLAIENHQDFGSAELVEYCEMAGPGVGITFDTGNTFPVAEAPLDFTRRIAPHVRHVHLKDYRVQFTDEGYRLVRCAIGDGAVPHAEMLAILAEHHDEMTAVLEPGALEVRHVRLFTPEWWNGYAAKTAQELAACLRAARLRHLPEEADYRTPWERGADHELEQYELDMIRRSAANMRAQGITTKEEWTWKHTAGN